MTDCLCTRYARATEWAALAGARWLGRADEEAAEEAAASGMKSALDEMPVDGRIVIGARSGEALKAEECEALGLVTTQLDDIDWDDEVRIFLEERASFSADGLTGLEANLRFAGPETMETKIFGRLTAWQNWIFQRPNAVGPEGALKLYGTGKKASYDPQRI